MLDTAVRGGTVYDGSGSGPRRLDVGIAEGVIVEIGPNVGAARHEIDASDCLVTPGWVDPHTHYDGQVMWDAEMAPSSAHGVTTVVTGNCGVGFAPVLADYRDELIALMEGVEDIPGDVLATALSWNWESFPDYLDAVGGVARTLDVGVMLTHGALRLYVMRDRCQEAVPTVDELRRMTQLAGEAAARGALGFSTSRTVMHTSRAGDPVPGTFAGEDELAAIVGAMRRAGGGTAFEVAPAGIGGEDREAPERELALMANISRSTETPTTFLLLQHGADREGYRKAIEAAAAQNLQGAFLRPQVFCRPICMLLSFRGENPFRELPAYQALESLSQRERAQALRNPEVRARILGERNPSKTGSSLFYNRRTWANTYPLGAEINYFPDADGSVQAIAERTGTDPREVAYDLLSERDATATLMYASANYVDKTPSACFEMLQHPLTLWGGSDAGAHVTFISDGSVPTYLLAWARDHADPNDPFHLSLADVVHRQTWANADFFGLRDRGLLREGYRADLNVVDLDRIGIGQPEMVYDLPGGKPRLLQSGHGYVTTVVSGVVTSERGELTGARPGRLAVRNSGPGAIGGRS